MGGGERQKARKNRRTTIYISCFGIYIYIFPPLSGRSSSVTCLLSVSKPEKSLRLSLCDILCVFVCVCVVCTSLFDLTPLFYQINKTPYAYIHKNKTTNSLVSLAAAAAVHVAVPAADVPAAAVPADVPAVAALGLAFDAPAAAAYD